VKEKIPDALIKISDVRDPDEKAGREGEKHEHDAQYLPPF
jgi:hypothetical protein